MNTNGHEYRCLLRIGPDSPRGRDSCLLVVFCLLFFCPVPSPAQYPPWWTNRSVIVSGAQTNDFAAVNQGQLKWIAQMARDELEGKLPGGAGADVEALISTFTVSNNYPAVNLGQLKNVAKPFYDRLIEEGLTDSYPWTTNTSDDADYALANMGQLKNVFSFLVPHLVTLDLDGIEITEGALGNSKTGPGNSPLNRAIVWENVPVGFSAMTFPPGTVLTGLTWMVVEEDVGTGDDDGDGICNNVDLEPSVSSEAFSDTSLVGRTSGQITQRGGRIFQIFDASDTNEGLRVIVGAGAQTAEVATVETVPLVRITLPGEEDDFILTAATVEIRLLRGVLVATAQGLDSTVTALLSGDSAVTFDLLDPQTLSVTCDTESRAPIRVSVNGEEPVLLRPGRELTTTFTSDIDGDGVLDGLDEVPSSDMRATVIIGEEDSGVPNRVNQKGWTILDMFAPLAETARNHGEFAERVAHLTDELKKQGLITGAESGAINSAAARSGIGKYSP